MGRRKQRVDYVLEPISDIWSLSQEDIYKILRAADEIIFSTGRTMLAKILKGSKDQKLLEHKLDKCPSYGCFQNLTITEITTRVDWMIVKGFLNIEYNGRLPMIVFSRKGWEIYKIRYSEELYERIIEEAHINESATIDTLKGTNREVIVLLLQKIGDSKNIGFIRFLEKWEASEVKKVRVMINGAIKNIKQYETLLED